MQKRHGRIETRRQDHLEKFAIPFGIIRPSWRIDRALVVIAGFAFAIPSTIDLLQKNHVLLLDKTQSIEDDAETLKAQIAILRTDQK